MVLGTGCEGELVGGLAEDDERGAMAASAGDDLGDDPGLCDRLTPKRGQLGPRATVKGKSYNVIQGTAGNDVLVGTSGPDLIFGAGGDDKIHGRGGDDIVCAGAGDDFVDGGLGKDRIYGQAGRDILTGGNGGDWIHGGGGDDLIDGGLLDDKLYGDDGDDVIIGGHGVDHMFGGPGKDWLRGDTNGDLFAGGAGYDVASFITARPTGRANRGAPRVMTVDLSAAIANGDGYQESLPGIEKVIGSAFDDAFSGPGSATFQGGYGADLCNGQPCGNGAPPALPFAYVDARPRDTGVVVLGSKGDDHLVFSRNASKQVVVTEAQGKPLHAGPHCVQTAVSIVTCTPGAPLRFLLAWGDDGKDHLVIEDGFPRDFTAHLDGGEGDDHLVGAGASDVLFTGRNGADLLDGRGGDDALISESYGDDRARPGNTYQGGADVLLGGGDNDQLVCDYPCGGHTFNGGPGIDIAGFARVGARSIHAQLGGPILDSNRSPFYGKAFLPGVCNVDKYGTTLLPGLEILEGSKGDDKLLGDEKRNIIWGRQGNDIIRGLGGNDILLGHDGSDKIWGGEGDDVIVGGAGNDQVNGGPGNNRVRD
jgi:Ca2+-binding RTX toxin-like protein